MPVIIALSFGVMGIIPLESPKIHLATTAITSKTPPGTFQMLRGHRQGNGVMLMWSMDHRANVSDFRIEATYEDPMDPYSVWMTRGVVEFDGRRMMQFRDQNVLPGTIYYRIYARMNNGSISCSEICTVRIISR